MSYKKRFEHHFINDDYENEISCDENNFAKDSQDTKIINNFDSENINNIKTDSYDSFKHVNDEKADVDNEIPVNGIETKPKIIFIAVG